MDQRNRSKKEIDYTMMEKNERDNVEISRQAYKPENAISDEMVLLHLGNRSLDLTADEIQQVKEWFEQIKVHVGDFMRERICQEVLKNAEDLELDFNTISEIQRAWRDAEDDENMMSLAKTIDELLLSGYFTPENWTRVQIK